MAQEGWSPPDFARDVREMERRVIRVLVADDSADFREGLRAMLEAVPDLEVVGEAATGDAALTLAARLQPDVVLMDLRMPVCNGIEATRCISASSPHIGVLVLTMFEADDSVLAAMRAGARGYILKGAPKAEMLRAIGAAANGEAIFSPAIARRLTGFFAAGRPASPSFPQLTEREREVLALLADGRSNPEIAMRLAVTLKTVQNHVSNICTKLQVADRTQAALRAKQARKSIP
jgi:DNA-binding NarL/FixJ family response regulator